MTFENMPLFTQKSGKLKNGKWKSHSPVRIGHAAARPLIHGPVKHSIPVFCFISENELYPSHSILSKDGQLWNKRCTAETMLLYEKN